jgi:TolB-like protein
MNFPTPFVANKLFSYDSIADQLDRIFLHPDFNKSEILKKFLSYIVHETLVGSAHCIKEYTIALHVLEKPVSFNPQKDCIVRIHAGRLRLALAHYYSGIGISDQIVIGIPKGKYVPVFMDRQQWIDEKRLLTSPQERAPSTPDLEPVIFAIMPLICTSDGKLIKAFNDNLCLQMCTTLSQLNEVSVIAYQAIKNLATKYLDLKELGTMVGFNHIITGGTQYVKNKIRINIQIIDSRTYKQIWSRIFESKVTPTNLFDIQDEICQQTIIQAQSLVNEY